MIIVKNKSNAPIEINMLRIHSGETKKIPNIRMNDHLRNLIKRGIIGASEIDDSTVLSSEESPKTEPKNNRSRKKSSIDTSKVETSIELTEENNSDNKSKSEEGEK